MWNIYVLLLFCLMNIVKMNTFEPFDEEWLKNPADLYDCQNEERILNYKADEKIELCCKYDSANLQSLTIHKEDNVERLRSDWNVTSIGESSVKLTIPAAQVQDSGWYACYRNGSKIVTRPVYIIGKVEAPKISAVETTIEANVTVWFYRGKSDPDIRDKFTVSIEPGEVLCTNKFTNEICAKTICKCTKKIKKWPFVKDENVTVIITKQRAVQIVETNQIFNLIDHIKPGSVTKLKIRKIKSTSATLRFCIPKDAYVRVYEMSMRKHPLYVVVRTMKTEGFYEEREFRAIFNEASEDCAETNLSHLSPFTRYNLSVAAVGGGGWGKQQNITFTTQQTAPLSSPKEIFYWIAEVKSKENNNSVDQKSYHLQQGKTFSINLYWKPIPHDEQGGHIDYEISVSDLKGKVIRQSFARKPYVNVRKIPYTSINVTVCARNRMGMSNCSSLVVEKDSLDFDISQLESHVEIEQNIARVFIQKPPPNIEVLAIYTCDGYVDPKMPTLLMCKDSPNMRSQTVDSLTFDLLSANVSLKDKECLTESTSLISADVSRIYKDKKFKSLQHKQNINVNITRRETTSCSSSFPQKNQLKFLYSVKRDGNKMHQLFPFRCYYDISLDTVMLKFEQTMEEDYVTLEWKQTCDFDRPRQFLAHKFGVYMSTDRKCQSPDEAVRKFDNKIIEPSAIKITQKNIFACVENFKFPQRGNYSETIHPYMLEQQIVRGDESPSHWILGIIIPAVFAVIIIAVLCRRQCMKRKEKMSKMLQDGNVVQGKFQELRIDDKEEEIVHKNSLYDYANMDSSKKHARMLGIDFTQEETSHKDSLHNNNFITDGESGFCSSGYTPMTKSETTFVDFSPYAKVTGIIENDTSSSLANSVKSHCQENNSQLENGERNATSSISEAEESEDNAESEESEDNAESENNEDDSNHFSVDNSDSGRDMKSMLQRWDEDLQMQKITL